MTDNYWHTGEPTEEGWYLITCQNSDYITASFRNGRFVYKDLFETFCLKIEDEILAWHKIQPYKEY